jgi:hypothetical protein
MEKTKKIGFFKRFKMAIFELENYIDFLNEKLSKSLIFSLKLVILLSFIMAVSNVIFVYAKYNSPDNYLNEVIPEFIYEKSELKIDENETKSDEKKQMAQIMKQVVPSITNILGDGTYTKADLIHYVQDNQKTIVGFGVTAIFIENILDLYIMWLMVAVLTSFIGWIDLVFLKIKMKYSKLFTLSIYASTLSVILTVIYTMLNAFAGVYIDMFDYLSILIAYIYITAVIYMIRSDLIKQQIELIRIATIQAEEKERLEREKEKEREREQEREDEPDDAGGDSKEEEEKKKESNDDIGDDEPDGSEI